MATHPFDLSQTDKLLTTTRAVRKRLDLTRPVPREVRARVHQGRLPGAGRWQRAALALARGRRPRRSKAGIARCYRRAYEPYIEGQKRGRRRRWAAPTPPPSASSTRRSTWPSTWPRCPSTSSRSPSTGCPPAPTRARPPASTARSCRRCGRCSSRCARGASARRGPRCTSPTRTEVAELLGMPADRQPGGPAAGRLLHRQRLQARHPQGRRRGHLLQPLEGEGVKRRGRGVSDLDVQDDPFAYYRERLSRCPVWHEEDTDLYVIGGHTEARAALMDVATFSSRPAAQARPAPTGPRSPTCRCSSSGAGRARPRSSAPIRRSTPATASCSTASSRRPRVKRADAAHRGDRHRPHRPLRRRRAVRVRRASSPCRCRASSSPSSSGWLRPSTRRSGGGPTPCCRWPSGG